MFEAPISWGTFCRKIYLFWAKNLMLYVRERDITNSYFQESEKALRPSKNFFSAYSIENTLFVYLNRAEAISYQLSSQAYSNVF